MLGNVISQLDPELKVVLIGYEYSPLRHLIGCVASNQLLEHSFQLGKQSSKLINLKVKLEHRDLFEQKDLQDCTIAYCFDKAFCAELCVKNVILWINSKNLKYVLTVRGHFSTNYKNIKFNMDELMDECGVFKRICTQDKLYMNGGESAGIFRLYQVNRSSVQNPLKRLRDYIKRITYYDDRDDNENDELMNMLKGDNTRNKLISDEDDQYSEAKQWSVEYIRKYYSTRSSESFINKIAKIPREKN